jgi:Zn-dependent peptidase ImmA (M78 family)
MTPSAQLASLLLEHLGISDKPDLHAICKALGLRVKELPLTGAHGALVRSKHAQKGIIAVKESLREQTQKRFTIAHEIGHFVIPYHKDLGSVCNARTLGRFGNGTPRPELEANEFAAEILLPAKLVKAPLKLTTPSLETISLVAKNFEAGLTATTWRYLDLTDQPCAMIWSRDGKAIWYRTSDALPARLWLDDLPAPQSLAGRFFAGQQTPNATKVDAQFWFNPPDAELIQTLIEESFHLPGYNAVLTLLWAQKMDRMPVSDDDERLGELQPEDFTLGRQRWPR